VRNKPIVETVESNNRPDEIVARKSWENYLKRNDSKIVDLFAGLYKSTLVCPDCKKISITFDPFLSVSVPIPNESLISLEMYFIYRNPMKVPLKINLFLPSTYTTGQLINFLSQSTNVSDNYIDVCFIRDHRIIEFPQRWHTVKYLREHQGD
jgi:hypothetical protein